jgi:acetyl esterase/lipase
MQMMRSLLLLIGLLAVAVPEAVAAPGRLISAEPLPEASADGLPEAARAWRIRYETRDWQGRPTESTGMVIAPAGAAGDRPVLAWQHGTVGVTEPCAVSDKPYRFAQIPGLAAMIARGWVVVATDYPGLGTRGPHAYLDPDSAGHAALDAVAAAGQIAAAGAGRRYALWGHSQGGHASLAAAERARDGLADHELVAVAAASPPTDLLANFGAAEVPIRSFLSAFAAKSWEQAFEYSLATLGNRTTQNLVRKIGARCEGDPQSFVIKIDVLRLLNRLGRLNMAEIEPWRTRLAASAVGAAPVGVPMLVSQGDADNLVAPAVTRDFVARACARGERLRYIEVPGGDHAGNPKAVESEVVAWLADRFAGGPAPTDCPD